MNIAEKIKYLRAKHNLTLEQVGDAVGVGKSTVRKWETGQIANMRRDKIEKLAKALHTSPAYLMGWEEEDETPREVSERELKFALFGGDVDNETLQDVLKYAEYVKQKNEKD